MAPLLVSFSVTSMFAGGITHLRHWCFWRAREHVSNDSKEVKFSIPNLEFTNSGSLLPVQVGYRNSALAVPLLVNSISSERMNQLARPVPDFRTSDD